MVSTCRNRMNWCRAILLLIITVLPIITIAGQTEDNAVARIIIFHSPSCPHCRIVVEETLPKLQARYGNQIEIRLYNIAEPTGYQVFSTLKQTFPNMPEGIPQVYIDIYVLVGSQEIPEQLPLIIENCLTQGGCDWMFTLDSDVQETLQSTDKPAVQSPIYLAYVFDASCIKCDTLNYGLEYLSNQYEALEIKRYDVRYDSAIIDAMGAVYDVPEDERLLAPAVYIGETYVGPDENSHDVLQTIIDQGSASEATAPWERITEADIQLAEQRITQRFDEFGLLTIAIAGLLDGLNPCAFTTIIFFISYLTLIGRRGREILLVGFAFTGAVFLSYLVMGIGLSAILERLGDVSIIGKIIYSGTALLCLGLAVVSFKDWLKIRRGEISDITLQLPTFFKKRIHGTIRKRSRVKGYITAAFIAGVIVSIFELACTGQVYLPTIVFMTSIQEARLTALFNLVIYNFMFVIPLVIVFVGAYRGTTSERFTRFFQNNVATVKILTVFLFGGLGIWLLLTTFGM